MFVYWQRLIYKLYVLRVLVRVHRRNEEYGIHELRVSHFDYDFIPYLVFAYRFNNNIASVNMSGAQRMN